MKAGESKTLLSPAVCWSLCAFFAVLSVMWQFVDVVPYPNRNRDYILGTLALCGATALFFMMARRQPF
jgi:hypothetical protein